jgi:hypothetical protein
VEIFEEDEEEIPLAAAAIVMYLKQAVLKILGARQAQYQQYLAHEDLLPNSKYQTP